MNKRAFLLPAALLLAGCMSTSEFPIDTMDTAAVPARNSFRARSTSKGKARNMALAKTAALNSPAAAGQDFEAPAGRKMTYTTNMTINLPDTREGVKKASAIAKKHQGHVVFSDNASANLKVPVANAAAALEEFEKLGTVTAKSITANDVTEHYTDTEVRLENLRRLQKRLGELLAKAVKVDEMLRIERELSRVTTDLERHQARMNLLNTQIAMVDFFLNFNAVTTPASIPRSIVPLNWVRKLGISIRTEKFIYTGETGDSPAKFDLPAGFATTHSSDTLLCAVTADSTVLKLEEFDNLPGATLGYYRTLVSRQLKYAGFTDITVDEGKTADGIGYLLFSAALGKDRIAIMIALHETGWLCKTSKAAVLEVYGTEAEMKKLDLKKLCGSFEF